MVGDSVWVGELATTEAAGETEGVCSARHWAANSAASDADARRACWLALDARLGAPDFLLFMMPQPRPMPLRSPDHHERAERLPPLLERWM